MSRIIKFFASLRLAIVLLILVILASILGTLIPQDRSATDYAARYGQLANVLMRLEITHLYRSGWYLALLLFLGLNITTCTLTRLAAKWTKAVRPKLQFEASQLQAMKLSGSWKKTGQLEDRLRVVLRELGRRRYRLQQAQAEGRGFILGRKRTLGLFGSDLVHLGLLVILAGGILSGWTGTREYLPLVEGQSAAAPREDFRIRLVRFDTELYPGGGVKDWKSTVTVIDGGRDILTKVVEVNHPLSYKGVHFYQASYGWDWNAPLLELWVKKKGDPAYLEKKRLRPGEKASLGPGLELAAERFVPDFVLGPGRRVESRSDEPRNPAVQVAVIRDSQPVFSAWVFANYPDFEGMRAAAGADFTVELKDARPSPYSVLEAAQDPGAGVIWLGCGLILAGLFLAFYWPPREIKVLLEENRGKIEITAAGSAAKNKDAFESEFQDFLSCSRKSE